MDEEQFDAGDDAGPRAGEVAEAEPGPLVRVRYGLGKELRLYPDTFVVALTEEHEETAYLLADVRRLILAPGEYNPAKLVVMFDLDDGNTVIAAEGMTNPRDFRGLVAKLKELHPAIELDPPDMNAQLTQALDIRRRNLLGCYGSLLGACLLIWVVFLVVAFIGAHVPR